MLHGYLLTMNCPKRTITKKWEYEAVKMWSRVSSSTHPRDRTANSSTAFNIGSCACTYTSKNDTQRHLGVHLRCRMRRATVKCNTSSCEPFFSNIQTHIHKNTCRIPLASTSKATSICGTPRGKSGSPFN